MCICEYVCLSYFELSLCDLQPKKNSPPQLHFPVLSHSSPHHITTTSTLPTLPTSQSAPVWWSIIGGSSLSRGQILQPIRVFNLKCLFETAHWIWSSLGTSSCILNRKLGKPIWISRESRPGCVRDDQNWEPGWSCTDKKAKTGALTSTIFMG